MQTQSAGSSLRLSFNNYHQFWFSVLIIGNSTIIKTCGVVTGDADGKTLRRYDYSLNWLYKYNVLFSIYVQENVQSSSGL